VAEPLVIGVDLGGTKILSGVVDGEGRVLRSAERQTPEGSEEALLAALGEAIEALLDESVTAVGLGVPAHLERGTKRVLRATNVALADLDLGAFVRERYGLPAGVENDANAAALAEWKHGAGRGFSTLVVLTLGTGVGGGLVLDGRPYRGWAELGHVVVQVDGPPCLGACTGRGHLEALVSGTAADRAAAELWGEGADARLLVDRARDGDEAALERLARMGHVLGAAIGSFVNMFDPELVVVGGGFGTAARDLLLEPARASARREALAPAGDRLRIVPAELGPEAGLVGAALVGLAALREA
jgi:glucokinase